LSGERELNKSLYCFETVGRFSTEVELLLTVACFSRQALNLFLNVVVFLLLPGMCGFLNSGLGGTVYIGILDGGTVNDV
jgi:hypothetical protein